jgi:hypothetical protein
VAKLAAVEQRGVSLSEELVLAVREEVLAAWATTGLTGEALQRLQSATIQITDLNSRGVLGLAGTDEIWLDDDALGYGWSFTDDADLDGDGEADIEVPEGTVDLATVLTHEFGHLVGWSDLDAEQYPGHLMAGELGVGERRGVGELGVEVGRGVDGRGRPSYGEGVDGRGRPSYGSGLTDRDVRPTYGGGVDGRGRPSYGSRLTDKDVRPTYGGGVDGRGRPSYGTGPVGRKAGHYQNGLAVLPAGESLESDSNIDPNLSVLDDFFADLSFLP